MESNQTRCYRCVGAIRKMIKYGKTKSGNQRYICRACGKTRVENYAYLAYKTEINHHIIQLTKEGLGIRSTERILKISTTTLLKRIILIARNIVKPIISRGKTYEVDELFTYIRHKKNYILALQRVLYLN